MSRYGMKTNKKFVINSLYLSKIIGACSGIIGFFLLFALPSFKVTDPSWFYYSSSTQNIGNIMGIVGAYTSAACFYTFGSVAYALIPLFFYIAHCYLSECYSQEYDRVWIAPLTIMTLCLLFHFYAINSDAMFMQGGFLGRSIYLFLLQWFDRFVIALCMYVALLSEFLILTRTSLIVFAHGVHAAVQYCIERRHIWLTPIVTIIYKTIAFAFSLVKNLFVVVWKFLFVRERSYDQVQQTYSPAYADQEKAVSYHAPVKKSDDGVAHNVAEYKNVQQPVGTLHSGYTVPGITLFAGTDKPQQSQTTSEHTHMAKVLEEKLSRFGVAGAVTKIKPGPVITLFEYQPDIDSKVSKILALEHDLALALEAMSVRIIAPIPGTSKVGFEVSNKERKSVRMGDIVRSQAFLQSRAHLPLVLGQDTSGENVVVDLIDMPHLLVAGSTGSGKSIALNAMLASLLCKLSPSELKLIIIDPKRLEFAAYHDIAHLLFPVITDPRKAAPVTQWLVKIMEDRYELMAKKGVRNILDYKRMCKEKGEQDILPFIVLMIDELADLMMVAGKDIEGNIARLAQMARAAGIHLIVATQRPSVDVITGVIKVNFPSRISFRVSSKIDSRTILDTGGAELLLGKGDMLFMDAQSSRIRRVHGAYVSDTEISALVNHIHQEAEVEYVDLQEALAVYQSAQHAQEESDPLLQDVMVFLSDIDEISISLLQRKFKIGYNRSARLIELLEMQGKVMPSMGGKMRRVVK
jgi:S-DNA-T family DNA segregation ATPase FtsK/SpoIIIE